MMMDLVGGGIVMVMFWSLGVGLVMDEWVNGSAHCQYVYVCECE